MSSCSLSKFPLLRYEDLLAVFFDISLSFSVKIRWDPVITALKVDSLTI